MTITVEEFNRLASDIKPETIKGVTYYFRREKDGLNMWAFAPPTSEKADYVGCFKNKKEAIKSLR